MIQTIVTHSCPKCGSDNMVRNGHDYKGAQKYYCHDCQSYGSLQAQRGYSFSDFWDTYQAVFAIDRHQSVGKDSGETNHIERWFNTLRQRLARFRRKTLSFSKLDCFHEAVFRLFVHHYNQTCISQ